MKLFGAQLLIVATLSMAGCASGGRYYASGPPPPARVEVRVAAPRAGLFWVDGYWGWSNRNYAWVPGRWVRAPRARAVWVAPAWEQRNGRYVFRKGRWR
jgi:hypothetical protein